jgi:hypothetical protein
MRFGVPLQLLCGVITVPLCVALWGNSDAVANAAAQHYPVPLPNAAQ